MFGILPSKCCKYSTSGTLPLQQLSTWNDFFKMRTKIKKVGLSCGIPSSFVFLFSESVLLSQPIFDPTMTIFGLDPILMVVLGTVCGSLTSFFVGSAIGKYVYSTRYPNLRFFLDQVSKIMSPNYSN